jgi:hypothetical protein
MIEWLESQAWGAELWVAVWCAAVVLVGLLAGFYGTHLKR